MVITSPDQGKSGASLGVSLEPRGIRVRPCLTAPLTLHAIERIVKSVARRIRTSQFGNRPCNG
jgi:hypothetical protein